MKLREDGQTNGQTDKLLDSYKKGIESIGKERFYHGVEPFFGTLSKLAPPPRKPKPPLKTNIIQKTKCILIPGYRSRLEARANYKRVKAVGKALSKKRWEVLDK